MIGLDGRVAVVTGEPEGSAATNAYADAGAMSEAKEIAAVVAFLASDDATYFTAAALVVDGGLSARMAVQ